MKALAVGLKLLVQAAAFAIAYPVQLLALRFGWRRVAGWVPTLFHRLFARLFSLRVVVRGHPPGGEPTLVLANHVSWLDIVVIGSLRPVSFVAKSEVAGWPVIGLFARMQRSVFIERARRSHTAKVNAAIAHRLARGEVIVLFAEGTTGDGNLVLPFRAALVGAAGAALTDPGVERIALQPLAITYVRRNGLPITRRERPQICWYGDMDLAPHLLGFFRQGPLDAVVTWGEPIPFDASSERKRSTAAAEAAVRRAFASSAAAARDHATQIQVSPRAQTA